MKLPTIALVTVVLFTYMVASAPAGNKKEPEKVLDSKFTFKDWVRTENPTVEDSKKGGEKRQGESFALTSHSGHLHHSSNVSHSDHHSGQSSQSGNIQHPTHDHKRQKSG